MERLKGDFDNVSKKILNSFPPAFLSRKLITHSYQNFLSPPDLWSLVVQEEDQHFNLLE
jgi:hypothetical protein